MIIEINDDSFEKEVLLEKSVVLVDFGAAWCGPCSRLHVILEELVKRTNVKICKVDIEDSPRSTSSHSIRSVPTIVFYKDGVIFYRITGLVSLEKLESIINSAS